MQCIIQKGFVLQVHLKSSPLNLPRLTTAHVALGGFLPSQSSVFSVKVGVFSVKEQFDLYRLVDVDCIKSQVATRSLSKPFELTSTASCHFYSLRNSIPLKYSLSIHLPPSAFDNVKATHYYLIQ